MWSTYDILERHSHPGIGRMRYFVVNVDFCCCCCCCCCCNFINVKLKHRSHLVYWQNQKLMLMLILLLLFLSMWNTNDILKYRSHPGIGRMWPKTEGWKQGHASLLFLSKIRQCVTITLVCGGVRFAKYEIKITWTQLLYAHKAGSKQEINQKLTYIIVTVANSV